MAGTIERKRSDPQHLKFRSTVIYAGALDRELQDAPPNSVYILYNGTNHYNAFVTRAEYEHLESTPFTAIVGQGVQRVVVAAE